MKEDDAVDLRHPLSGTWVWSAQLIAAGARLCHDRQGGAAVGPIPARQGWRRWAG